ncbi:MAG: hypothetical protein D6751_10120 [Deltaproteobacteria bacterium]|nr:MAG: hypothetical protein D6751_10120 [Deltaproteobacteria bacterium]
MMRMALVLCCLLLAATLARAAFYQLPPQPPQNRYGDLLLDRVSSAAGQKPVFFSHFTHRLRDTCRVCHFELGFAMKQGETEITEEANREGMYCGACHDGLMAFGHNKGHCDRCHTGDAQIDMETFGQIRQQLPPSPWGNGIDWSRTLDAGLIAPRYSLYHPEEQPMGYDKRLELSANWSMVPPAVFDHKSHGRWLDCNNCHPDVFNIRKKTTAHFEMRYILEGKFCGYCHGKVALPLDDCNTCHPGIKMR